MGNVNKILKQEKTMIIEEIRKRMVEIGQELTEIEKKEAPKEEDEIQTDKLITEFTFAFFYYRFYWFGYRFL
ncbi:unnamed protein product [marine sediment metagenome]|uniref:Uncharacterized protein n=1 Tax=marine sediment metagenome TaxID=412755 RepID=X1D5A6_9ZZZZ